MGSIRVFAQAPGSTKTALVTGGNTGIGFETAKALCAKGYRTMLACRNLDKARAATEKIKAGVVGAQVEAGYMDLADLSTVRAFASSILDSGDPLDVLVNNAGVMACPKMVTVDGFEYQFGVNHLGHFLLTNLLMPLMGNPNRGTRIVNVSSEAHKLMLLFGRMDFDDLMLEKKGYQRWAAYGQSKLANILFTNELSRRVHPAKNITVNSLHPGFVRTELQRYLLPDPIPWYLMPINEFVSKLIKTPAQGAETSIYLATSPDVEGVSGKYFISCQPAVSTSESLDEGNGKKLWSISAELTNFGA